MSFKEYLKEVFEDLSGFYGVKIIRGNEKLPIETFIGFVEAYSDDVAYEKATDILSKLSKSPKYKHFFKDPYNVVVTPFSKMTPEEREYARNYSILQNVKLDPNY